MHDADFELSVEIAAPLATVHRLLGDLHRVAALHPLIESIETLPATPERPNAHRYRVLDRVAFGPLRFPARYEASLEATTPRQVVGQAWQPPGIRLRTQYDLLDRGETTLLREQCSVKAPFGLRRFVVQQARAAHRETLKNLKKLLEGKPATD